MPQEVRSDGLVLAVTRTPPDGQPLVEHKGINFPDTALNVSPLTESDMAAIDFAAENAEIVGYSFVQRPSEIALLQDELDKRRPGKPPLAIVAKVETKLAFPEPARHHRPGSGPQPLRRHDRARRPGRGDRL